MMAPPPTSKVPYGKTKTHLFQPQLVSWLFYHQYPQWFPIDHRYPNDSQLITGTPMIPNWYPSYSSPLWLLYSASPSRPKVLSVWESCWRVLSFLPSFPFLTHPRTPHSRTFIPLLHRDLQWCSAPALRGHIPISASNWRWVNHQYFLPRASFGRVFCKSALSCYRRVRLSSCLHQ